MDVTDYKNRFGAVYAASATNKVTVIDVAEDPFFVYGLLDETVKQRWNQSYPFELIVVRKNENSYRREQSFPAFTLPIPPESLTFSMPAAISTSATLGGVIEEHNGAPFRFISLSGTTGLFPLRGAPTQLGSAGVLASVFAGTLTGVNNTITQAKSIVSLGRPNYIKNLISDADLAENGSSTGYYQFRVLQRFLESYVTLKKTDQGKDLRLAFAMWKDDAIYLVTPLSFEMRRSSESPLEYFYSLQFKAFKRIRLDSAPSELTVYQPVIQQPGALSKILNTVQAFRRTAQAAKGVVTGFRADINTVLEGAREVAFFVKDVLNVIKAVADLPKNIISDLNETILAFASLAPNARTTWESLGKSLTDVPSIDIAQTDKVINSIKQAFEDTAVLSGKTEVGAGAAPRLSQADAIVKILDDPGQAYILLSAIDIKSLNVPPAVTKRIEAERVRIQKLNRADFEDRMNSLVEFAADLADAVGLGSLIYNNTYNRTAKTQIRTATMDDYDLLFSLNSMILAVSKLASSSTINRNEVGKNEFFINTARQSEIDLQLPVSKYAVPFPYGSTLEQVSARYLNDPNRWHEIALINNLRAPYIDEEGFDLPLLANGRGNSILVSDGTNLLAGQSVYLNSTGTLQTQRRIVSVETLVDGNVLVLLDGDATLESYTLAGNATLHAYLPDTINSQSVVYIPSVNPSTVDNKTKNIPGINQYDPLLNVGGVDILLTQSGDIAISPDGDTRLAVGYTNIVQTAKLAFSTPQGSLIQHPFYGFGIIAGTSTADLSAQQILSAAQSIFRSDPTFSGVQSASIVKTGPVAQMSITVGIAGTDQLLPLTFDVKR